MRLCPQCRGEKDACKHPETVWHMWREVCHKTVALEAAKRLHAEEYKDAPWCNEARTVWAKEFSAETPIHYKDGVTLWVQDTPQHPVSEPPDAASSRLGISCST